MNSKPDPIATGCGIGFGFVFGVAAAIVVVLFLFCGGFLMLLTNINDMRQEARQKQPVSTPVPLPIEDGTEPLGTGEAEQNIPAPEKTPPGKDTGTRPAAEPEEIIRPRTGKDDPDIRRTLELQRRPGRPQPHATQ